MDLLAAYREVGSGSWSDTTPTAPHRARTVRGHNYDDVHDLVVKRVAATHGKISAKRLLPAARTAGYTGQGSGVVAIRLS